MSNISGKNKKVIKNNVDSNNSINNRHLKRSNKVIIIIINHTKTPPSILFLIHSALYQNF